MGVRRDKPSSGEFETGFPSRGGELGALMRALDWSRTSLGPIAEWSEHLKSAVNLMLPSKAQIVLFWGPNFVALYNDAYAPTIGDKHPRALGRPAQESWTEVWDDLEPLLRRVLHTGETVFAKDRPFYIERHGYPESVYFDISYSPVQAETGEVEGVLCIVSETTERVVAQAALARAQERLTQALSAAGMVGTFDWHVQTDIFYSDARFAEMFSVDPARGEKGAPLADYLAGIHPEDVERIANAVNHAVATQEKYAQEYRLVRKDGTVRWVEARGECLYGEDGKADRFVGVVVDITSQKNAQERQRLLAREADHRVKNIFANFHSMISLSARSARTPQEMAQALRGRMDALLRAKDLIRPAIWVRNTIASALQWMRWCTQSCSPIKMARPIVSS
jgi:PAS domain-containing protein